MQYPTILLPQTHFKYIESDLSEHHICRTTPTKSFLNDNNSIKDEELCEKPGEFFDYSTNHLGQFELNHNYFSLAGDERRYFRSYWDFASQVKTPTFEKDFVYDDSKGIFFFKIGHIHNNIKFPITNSEKKPDQVTAIVKHTPSNSNFWHFSIRWIDQKGNEISANDSKWKNAVVASIRAKLQEIFITDAPAPSLIPEGDYTKAKT